MRSLSPTPPLVPDNNFAVHIVLDDFGKAGLIYREVASEDTTRAAVIEGIIGDQYYRPSRIIAFNTAEGWARDVRPPPMDLINLVCGARSMPNRKVT
jgi:hypothetical protein